MKLSSPFWTKTMTEKQLVATLGGCVVLAILIAFVVVTFTDIGVAKYKPEPSAVAGTVDDDGPFTVRGVVTEESPCRLHGAQVVVQDSSGRDLAVGTLKEERPVDGDCPFTFTVSDVPPDQGLYQLEIGNRAAPRHTEDELRAGVSLSFR